MEIILDLVNSCVINKCKKKDNRAFKKFVDDAQIDWHLSYIILINSILKIIILGNINLRINLQIYGVKKNIFLIKNLKKTK